MNLRKTFLAAIAVATSAFSASALAQDQETYNLSLAQTWGPNTPILAETTKHFAEMAEKMSDGRLKIRIDPSSKHKAPFGIFDMVRSGQYDLGHTASYYYKGTIPNAMYFTTIPFGLTAPEMYAWFYYGGGMDLMEQVYRPYGLLSFPGGNTGNQMGGWFRKEIKSLDDLKGLKMRTPGLAGEVMSELGVAVTNIPPGELFSALERGTIDAAEWVGPALDFPMGFQQIAKYYYSGWQEPGAEVQFLVNEKTWDKLPADLQEILRVAMRTAAHDMYIESYHENAMAWDKMKENYPDVQHKVFPPEVINALRKTTDKLLEQYAEKDPMARKIISSQRDYLKIVRKWTNISDKAYLESSATE
ncbi:TRAP-type mannitol/chloroaromatic compound transport system, periplasmic component [Marinobacter santoriniensis NKSG1]|uniref:TRAP-type mannitol/chloroaromatic compound transport system, periplasmic component n=1 Tax=Marinobacter santoriniensis NKSG1 TaxID=1288826 RepID=M7CL06_9GAMM|nr:TRAP transporter substrate-binding protein DctP [Marinobacter santoriniensis]EMP54331.1 TRAP-type mannitol/chloroaromatic compound transport system, periplasmic component [Marinobacter santoriniensis NKSG1]